MIFFEKVHKAPSGEVQAVAMYFCLHRLQNVTTWFLLSGQNLCCDFVSCRLLMLDSNSRTLTVPMSLADFSLVIDNLVELPAGFFE